MYKKRENIPKEYNKNLSRRSFILLSMCLSMICTIIASVVVILSLGNQICGFIPSGLVAFACAVGQIIGTTNYIKKHKYAYGEIYEWYQIINSSIYGIQNVLRVLLVVVLINIFTIPVLVILGFIYGAYVIKKMFK